MEDKNQKIRENRRSENKSSRLSLSSWFSNLHNNLMKHLGIKKEEVQQVKIPFIFRKKSPSIKAFEESARFSIAKIRAKDFTSYTPERLHQLLKPEMLVPKQLFKNPKVRKELQEQIEKDRKQFLEEWNKFYYLPDEDVQLFIQDLEKIREKTIREYKDKSKEREMSIKEEHELMNNFNQQLIKISNEFLDKHPQKIPVYTVVCYFYYVHGIFHEMPALCSRMIAMVPENKFFNLRDGIYPSSLGLLAVAMENNDIPRTRGLLKAIKEMNKILPEKMPEFNMPEHKVFILNAEPWIAYLNGLELYEEDPNKAIEEFQRAMDLVKQEQFSLSIEKDIPLLIELASIQTRIMNLKKVNNFKELSAIIESLMPDLRDRWIKIGKNRGKKWLNLSEREYEFERKCYHLGERGADLLEICFLSRSNIIEALKKMLENSEWNHSLLNEAREFFNKIGFVNEIKFTNKVDSFVNLTLKRMAIKECSNVKILSDEDQIELLRELQDTENLSKKIPPETISFFKELLQEYIKRERNIDGNEENLELKKEIHLVWYNNSEPKGEPISAKSKEDKIKNAKDWDLLIVREETGTQVFINGQKSKSPPSKLAYRILRYVLQHKGRGGSAWNIAQHVWSKDFPGLIDEPKELAKAVIKESDLKKAQDLKKKIDYWSSRTRRKVIDLNKYLMKTLKIKLEAKELDEYELSPKTPNYCLIEKV